jgi:hypothetical protein
LIFSRFLLLVWLDSSQNSALISVDQLIWFIVVSEKSNYTVTETGVTIKKK